MEGHKLGRAPNFTGACVVMFGVNLAWVLLLLFAVYGLIAAVFLCLVLNHWLGWLEQRRKSEAQRYVTVGIDRPSSPRQ